jgi:hypothetical protein
MSHTEEDMQFYLTDGVRRYGNSFSQFMRRNAGLPTFEYMEVSHALAGTEKSRKNLGSLNDMGSLGWEIMFVAQTNDPETIHIIYKKRKID